MKGFGVFRFVCNRNDTQIVTTGHMICPVWPKTYQNVVHEALLCILKVTNMVAVRSFQVMFDNNLNMIYPTVHVQ